MCNRFLPNGNALLILTNEEIQNLQKIVPKAFSHLKDRKYITVEEATKALAKLGGFLGRKNDGKPGIINIWRGWNKLKYSFHS